MTFQTQANSLDSISAESGLLELTHRKLTHRKSRDLSDVDATPMVDVVFLLLIFFMVTASFTIEKTMRQKPQSEQPTTSPTDTEQSNSIEVTIDQYNTFGVRVSNGSDQVFEEIPSRHELIGWFRETLSDGTQIEQLKIVAHPDSWHEKVITAMDVGTKFGLELSVVLDAEE